MEPNENGVFVLIETIRAAAGALRAQPVSDEQIVDVIGHTRALERRLAEWRRGLESEVTSGDKGTEFEVQESRSAKRSYNTNGILAAFTQGMHRPEEALYELIAEDALRLTWRWTQLQAAAQRHDVTLAVAKHEIEDGDPDAVIGEVWTSKTTIVPLEVE